MLSAKLRVTANMSSHSVERKGLSGPSHSVPQHHHTTVHNYSPVSIRTASTDLWVQEMLTDSLQLPLHVGFNVVVYVMIYSGDFVMEDSLAGWPFILGCSRMTCLWNDIISLRVTARHGAQTESSGHSNHVWIWVLANAVSSSQIQHLLNISAF